MFELLEHTADIGFRARGDTQAELFENAAEALVSIAMETDGIAPRQSYPLAAAGEDPQSLLVNWLSEVLFWLDARHIAMRRFEVREIGAGHVTAQAFGEPRSPERHRAKLVVKGVTYHQLRVWTDENGWWAEVYLDI